MPAAFNGATALAAQRLVLELQRRLGSIEDLLLRLVELQQSPSENFLAAGSTAYGGTIGTTPTGVVRANPNRRGLNVQNIGTAGNLTIGLGSTTPTSGMGLVLAPGASWDGRISGNTWTGRVHVVGSAAGVLWSALEVLGPGPIG